VSIFQYTGYGAKRTIARRIAKMEAWLRDPQLLEGSHNHIMIITIVTIMIITITITAKIHINLEDI